MLKALKDSKTLLLFKKFGNMFQLRRLNIDIILEFPALNLNRKILNLLQEFLKTGKKDIANFTVTGYR